MPTLKLALEYHGGKFFGWAVQPGFRTVEQTVLDALGTVLGSAPSLSAAGRTDAGVHARGQVVSFTASDEAPGPQALLRSLNGVLPHEVAVAAAEAAPDGFDARRDARSRTYRYRVLARPARSPFERDRALWWPHPVDEPALEACARVLPGRHDFTAFTPTRTEHVRFERDVLRAEWRRADGALDFWIEADTFMRHMVRVLVGTMLEVGARRRDPDSFAALLAGAPRTSAGPTAEPHGLCLESVSYQPLSSPCRPPARSE
jgi:tRNA pseudouridine38-40 synthase